MRRHGATWISEESTVARVLAIRRHAGRAARAAELVVEAPLVARAYRYAAVRMDAPPSASFARLSWYGTGGRAQVVWRLGSGSATWVVDLRGTAWDGAGALARLEVAADVRDGVRLEWCALLGDLGQLGGGDLRWDLASRHLRGVGVECGALQHPLPLPPQARVFYLDRLTAAGARADYPELDGHPLTVPNVVGDVQRLPLRTASVDFHVGNHLLEHARDPIGGLEEMLRVVRPGGVLYVSVPDCANPLDRLRPVTPFEHLLADHEVEHDRAAEDAAHYREALRSAHPTMARAELDDFVGRMWAQSYSIHFHTFDEPAFRALLRWVGERCGARVIEFARNPGSEFDEYVACLRRVA
ncbi:MAG: methyltransferase domain-containing protein [bacterium]|nr:methyltransferase domain-containing protein [bacterium]